MNRAVGASAGRTAAWILDTSKLYSSVDEVEMIAKTRYRRQRGNIR